MGASGPRPECADPDGGAAIAPPSLWEPMLGPAAWAALPSPVRALRNGASVRRYVGRVEVERGRSVAARLVAACLRLPAAGTHALTVEITRTAGGERWSRRFGERLLDTRLSIRHGRLTERLGAVALGFGLSAGPGALHWRAETLRLAGIAVPRRAFDVRAREFGQAGRYRFEVSIRLAPIGLLIAYAGCLDVD